MSVLPICINAHLENRKIVFFGIGLYSGSTIRNIYPQIAYFCDNAPTVQGTNFWGKPVHHPDKLLSEDRNITTIIINSQYYGEIAKQLFDMGFKDIYSNAYKNGCERITKNEFVSYNFLIRKAEAISHYDTAFVRSLFEDDTSKNTFDALIENYKCGNFDFSAIRDKTPVYFNDIFRDDLISDEVYLDAGTFDGKTLVDFIFYTKGKYKKIYAFEPDIANYLLISREFSNCRDVIVENIAVSGTDGETALDMRGTYGSKLVYNKSENDSFTDVKTMKLDSFINEPVSFIKMDIEGVECEALTGARETIKEHKPKLAISLYHNDDDLTKIPLLIHGILPEYKFYLRHHSKLYGDTVLYAKI